MMIFIIWTYTGQENKIVQQTCLNITVHTLYRTLPHLRWKWRQCTGENSVKLTKDFKLTISFQKRILAGYWLNFTFLTAVFRPVLDHPLLLCFSTPILVLHHFSSLALVALFDTNVFLLKEYFIELNSANFKILNTSLNWIFSENWQMNQIWNWILSRTEKWINIWIEFCGKTDKWIFFWIEFC